MNSTEMQKSRKTLLSVITALFLLTNIFYILFSFIIYYYTISKIIVCVCILTSAVIAIITGVHYKNVVPRYARVAVYISAPIQLLASVMTVFMGKSFEAYLISHIPNYYPVRTVFVCVAAILLVAITVAALYGIIKNAMSQKIGTVIKKIFLCVLTAIFIISNLYFLLFILQNASDVVGVIISSSYFLHTVISTDGVIAPLIILPISEVFAAVFIVLLYRKDIPLYHRIAAYAAVPMQLIAINGLWAVYDRISSTLSTSEYYVYTSDYKAYCAFCVIVFIAVSVLMIIGTVKMLAKQNDKSADTPAPVTA